MINLNKYRILKVFVASFLLVLIFTSLWWVWPARTPGISSDHAVASLEFVEINGQEQCILVRSHNSEKNPILLFLHGGPGMPMMYLAHEFQRPLEKQFTVVQWDRRGAGKTYSHNIPSAETMTISQLADDALVLIDTLRERYGQEKIILAGHSFGSYLGSILVSEKPELFHAYISIGQVVDEQKAKELQLNFVRDKAIELGREDILKALSDKNHQHLEGWLFEFGGELKNSTSFLPLLWSGLKAPEYTLEDAINVGIGSSFSSSNMDYDVISGSILDHILEYQLPVFFFVGTSDYATPHPLITDYYQMVKAPKKEIIYFKESAHFPFYEEPDYFCKAVIEIWLDLKQQQTK